MAISSEVQVYNLALNAVGERSNISLPTENSRPAEVCRLWYEVVRDQVLSAAPWPEATTLANLATLAEVDDEDGWVPTQPRPGYSFVYSMPTDALRPRYLSDFSTFLISHYGEASRALHTNTENAVLAYTARLTNPAQWDPELQMAIVYALAANICMPLSGKPSRAKMLVDKANEIITSARVNAANSSNEFYDSTPDWIAARGYRDSQPSRYFYPQGSLLAFTNVG